MDSLYEKKGWFSELSTFWPGQSFSLEIEEKLHEVKSEYQEIQVFQTKSYGKMLALDGVIQLTERDEFSYQEMMAHVALFAHPKPEHVCIIGGGDGGVLTEVCKHPSVVKVTLCEIDEEVIKASKQFFPKFRRGFNDPRVNIYYGDGAQFLKDHPNTFDVVITDSSDPIGPASSLFEAEYYHTLKNSLREGGITASQGECMWIHLDMINKLSLSCKKIFRTVEYAYICIPTYPSGQIGILLCTDNEKSTSVPVTTPVERFSEEDANSLLYYSSEVHSAAFVLPPFVKKMLC